MTPSESTTAVEGMDSMSNLFEKPVPVRIGKAGHEDRLEELTVRILLGASKQNRNSRVSQGFQFE
jgi:hypothetical protein